MSELNNDNTNTAKLIYILYMANILIPFLGIIGLIMAYVNRGDASPWMQSHYRFQIRTFWIGLLYLFVGVLLTFILIGYLVLLFWLVWLIVRCVKGIKFLDLRQAYPNPGSWLFG